MVDQATLVFREIRPDELKGFAILAVVAIHTGFPLSESLRFCVPVFIAVWAYLQEKAIQKNNSTWRYTCQRFIGLFVPYAFWTGIYILAFPPVENLTETSIQTLIGSLLGGYGWPGQYFFIIIFQLIWLFPLLRRMVARGSIWILLVTGALINAVSLFAMSKNYLLLAIGDRLFIYWIPYVILGIGFAHGFPKKHKEYMLGVMALFYAPWEIRGAADQLRELSPYLFPSVAIGSIAMLLALGPRLDEKSKETNSVFSRVLCSMGRQSLCIFVCHMIIVKLLWSSSLWKSFGNFGLLANIVVAIAAICGSLAIGWLLMKGRLGILVGR